MTPSKRPPVVRMGRLSDIRSCLEMVNLLIKCSGVNQITTLVEQKKASLVCIAGDVDPIEIVLHLPFLCRKMGVPYCIVKGGRARLGHVVRRKSVACVALTNVNPEDKATLSKLTETIRTNFNERFDEIRRQWGGGIVSARSKAKITKLEKAKSKEAQQKFALVA